MNRRAFLSRPASFLTNSSKPARPLATTGLEPFTGTWDYAAAAHLVRRTMFGAKHADTLKVLGLWLDMAVDELLAPPPANDPPAPIYYNGTNMGTDWTNLAWTDTNTDNQRLTYLQTWYFQQMIEQPMSISEKMTLFWTNHFATGANSVKDSRFMYAQNAMLRQHALGNFKTLVKEITVDPAMLVFLNGNLNTKTGPNENYGRELQELFTIGKGPEISPGNYTNYTEADIKAAARVLTGWKADATNITYSFKDSDHVTTDKQFSSNYQNTVIKGRSGRTGAEQEMDELISMIFNQQATALYICRKIYRWFVSTEITTDTETNVIVPLADLLRQGNYEIKPVMAKLLKSAHFFDMANRGAMIKSPVDFGIGTLRAYPVQTWYKADPTTPDLFLPTTNQGIHWALRPFRRNLATMQQDLFNPPNVAGLPAYYQTPQFDELWINADTLQKRVKVIDDLLIATLKYDEEYGYALINVIEMAKQVSDPSSVTKLIDEWSRMLFPVELNSDQKQAAQAVLLGSKTATDWQNIWNAYIQAPTDKAKADAADAMLRPLARHLMALAEYQLM